MTQAVNRQLNDRLQLLLPIALSFFRFSRTCRCWAQQSRADSLGDDILLKGLRGSIDRDTKDGVFTEFTVSLSLKYDYTANYL